MKKIIASFFLLTFVVSCATPTVVNVVEPTDNSLSCSQIDTQIAMAVKYADDAKKEKSMVTGTNVEALLFCCLL